MKTTTLERWSALQSTLAELRRSALALYVEALRDMTQAPIIPHVRRLAVCLAVSSGMADALLETLSARCREDGLPSPGAASAAPAQPFPVGGMDSQSGPSANGPSRSPAPNSPLQ